MYTLPERIAVATAVQRLSYRSGERYSASSCVIPPAQLMDSR
jgi:hypothetical protein